jgi:hypothetical protein
MKKQCLLYQTVTGDLKRGNRLKIFVISLDSHIIYGSLEKVMPVTFGSTLYAWILNQ